MTKCDAMMRFRLPKETKEVLRRIADERSRVWQKRVTMSDIARERLIDSVLIQPHDKYAFLTTPNGTRKATA